LVFYHGFTPNLAYDLKELDNGSQLAHSGNNDVVDSVYENWTNPMITGGSTLGTNTSGIDFLQHRSARVKRGSAGKAIMKVK